MRERHKVEDKPFDEETWGGEELVREIVEGIKARPSPTWWMGVEEWENSNPLKLNGEMDLGEDGIKRLLEREKEERPRKKSKVDKGDAKTAFSIDGATQKTPTHTSNPEPGALTTPGPVLVSYAPPFVTGKNERSPSPERPANRTMLVG